MAITTGVVTRSQNTTATDWNAILAAAKSGAASAINDWLNLAKIDGGDVTASLGRLTEGCLKSDLRTFFAGMKATIMAQGVAEDIARAITKEITEAWNMWAASFKHNTPLALPMEFSAYPAAYASPRLATPWSLSLGSGSSSQQYRLTRQELSRRLLASLPNPGTATPSTSTGGAVGSTGGLFSSAQSTLTQSMQYSATGNSVKSGGSSHFAGVNNLLGSRDDMANSLASYIDDSFFRWKSHVSLQSLMGQGPTTWAPPTYPAGQVVGGKITGEVSAVAFG